MGGKPVRQIKKVWKQIPTMEGAGVRLKRVFGFPEVPQLDPFLLLDCFRSDNRDDYIKGFPWHPHRGMETITYVLDGEVEHQDSLGNRGVIRPGDVQWMTAGSAKGGMWGFQLWANLPKRDKMMDPRYREVTAQQIPAVKTPEGATVRIISGKIGDVQGPVQEIVTDPEYLDVSLPAGKAFTHAVKPGYTVFAYVVEGEGHFDHGPTCVCKEGDIALVTTDKKSVRFLFISGKPLNEPVAWYGPVVMNTQEELRQAFQELDAGSFIRRI
jgi:quercetin 2,3-dioxygenase